MLAVALVTLVFALGAAVPVAAEGRLQDVETAPYGTFNEVDYVRHTGQFVGTAANGWPMFGGFEDLTCTPRADGGTRFADHAAYVRRFREVAQELGAAVSSCRRTRIA
jgi:hypothetical protein